MLRMIALLLALNSAALTTFAVDPPRPLPKFDCRHLLVSSGKETKGPEAFAQHLNGMVFFDPQSEQSLIIQALDLTPYISAAYEAYHAKSKKAVVSGQTFEWSEELFGKAILFSSLSRNFLVGFLKPKDENVTYDFIAKHLQDRVTFWITDIAGNMAGYGSVQYQPDKKFCELSALFLREDYRGRGIATEVLRLLHRSMPPGLRLELFSKNTETNAILRKLFDAAYETVAYKAAIKGHPANAEVLASMEATKNAILIAAQERRIPWITALLHSGWKITLIVKDPAGFCIFAEAD